LIVNDMIKTNLLWFAQKGEFLYYSKRIETKLIEG